MTGRQKEVKRHLTSEELDEAIDTAQQADEGRLVRRLVCIKTLYLGDTLAEAAHRAGVDPTTVGRWIDRWNDGGVDGLGPSFGGGKPLNLSKQDQKRLQSVLADHQPWTTPRYSC